MSRKNLRVTPGDSQPARGARNPTKSRNLLRDEAQPAPQVIYAFALKANHPVARFCRVGGVSASGFYARCGQGPSPRTQADAALTTRIPAIHAASQLRFWQGKLAILQAFHQGGAMQMWPDPGTETCLKLLDLRKMLGYLAQIQQNAHGLVVA